MWSFEFSANAIANDVVAGLIVAAILVILTAVWRYVWPRARNFTIASIAGRRQRERIELLKRIRSDAYFNDRQRMEVIRLLIVFGTGIIALQLYQIGHLWSAWIPFMLSIEGSSLATLIKERVYNEKALAYRMRARRKRRNPA
jgi:hypothetical protein